jgi:hypothetical protein
MQRQTRAITTMLALLLACMGVTGALAARASQATTMHLGNLGGVANVASTECNPRLNSWSRTQEDQICAHFHMGGYGYEWGWRIYVLRGRTSVWEPAAGVAVTSDEVEFQVFRDALEGRMNAAGEIEGPEVLRCTTSPFLATFVNGRTYAKVPPFAPCQEAAHPEWDWSEHPFDIEGTLGETFPSPVPSPLSEGILVTE